MNTQFAKMFSDAEGGYLDDGDFEKLGNYASTLEARMRASKRIQQSEAELVEPAVQKMMNAFPELPAKHGDVRSKTGRDVTLVLRYCTLAMVRDDMPFLEQKLLYWLRTILQSFFPRKVMDVTYRELANSCQRNLDAESLQLLGPYLKRTHEILTQKR